jgi:RNA polymerase sigma factor (sigma-70 family)
LALFRAGANDAFEALLERHANMVYSAALRQVFDAPTAADVTSVVFTALARKAGSLPANIVVAAWLHRATRLAALKAIRTRARRQRYEEEAARMHELTREEQPEASWEEIAPLLDEGLARLAPKDHEAIVLRYFGNKTFAEVAQEVGASEEAARKRVNRAIEKLRRFLAHRGLFVSAKTLQGLVQENATGTRPPWIKFEAPPPLLVAATLRAIEWHFFWKQVFAILVGIALLGIAITFFIAPATSPLEAFRALTEAAAEGDADRWARLVHTASAEEELLRPLLTSNMVAQAEVRREVIRQFGQSAYENSSFPRFLDDTPADEINRAVVTINGGVAQIQLPRGSNLRFVRVDNAWKFDFFRTAKAPPAQLRFHFERGLQRLSGFNAGGFTNVDLAADAFARAGR